MQKLSVVIVCKNEETIIGETIASFSGLTDDIVIYDNGSTDSTKEIVGKSTAKLIEGRWEGFGKTKNNANACAKYDWILSLDADEAIDDELKINLLKLNLDQGNYVYMLRFKNFLGNTWLRFGEWGSDKHTRLFNRQYIYWNDAYVHETLILPLETEIKTLKGFIIHKTARSIQQYESKMRNYALLNAKKYFLDGKRSNFILVYFSPIFSFIKNYFFKLGFLDGVAGFHCARINAGYTYLKYRQLNNLQQNKKVD